MTRIQKVGIPPNAGLWEPAWRAVISVVVVLSLVRGAISAHASQPAADDFSAIDSFVQAEMLATRLPGAALAIVKDDQVVHLKGFGRAGETGRAVNPQTPFVLGSTTKSFTALAIMQLVEAGKVGLDEPVQLHLPWFRVADPEASAQITIRHLLNQTSGLPGSAGTSFLLKAQADPLALEREVRKLKDVALDRAVGQSFEYCNLNYGILGLVIEAVSGQTYAEYIERQVFAPLGMANSYADYGEARQSGLAQGYLYSWAIPRPTDLIYNGAGLPSGYLVSSAEDLSHYMIAQLNQGRYGNVSILSPDGMTETHRPAVVASGMGNSTAYGMGWFVGEMEGVPAFWHPGNIMNFHSDMILAPESGWGIAVLLNGNDFTGAPGIAIASGILRLLMGQGTPSPSSKPFPIVQLVLLTAFLVQLAALGSSIAAFRRWRTRPETLPKGSVRIALSVGIPLGLSLAWAAVCLLVLPAVAGTPLFDLRVLDIGQEALLNGFLALGWGILGAGLASREIRRTVPQGRN